MGTLSCTYPGFLSKVKELVEDHKELVEEPLRLAIYYAPKARDNNDVFLFEVLDNFDADSIEQHGDMLEVTYGSTHNFAMPYPDSRLHLILTNARELREASAGKTILFNELKLALDENDAQIIHSDPDGEKLKTEVFQ